MSVAVCQKLEELREQIEGLRDDLPTSTDKKVFNKLQYVSNVLDQFYIVLKRDGGIQCSYGTQQCLQGFKECDNAPSMCVYAGTALSPTVRDEACNSPHAPGDVFMISSNSAFPGTNASKSKFPVAYAKSADLNSSDAIMEHLKRNLRPNERISPRIM